VELTVRQARQYVVVGVSGAIEPKNAPTLRECLLRVLNTAPPYVILDISRVEKVDPAGLAVIAEAHRGARLLGGSLGLACPEHTARDLLDHGVLPMMPRYSSADAAIAERRASTKPRYFSAGAARRTSA
jgi:anti-anti-sigma factor